VHGRWTDAPAKDLFSHMQKKLLLLPVVAEDLGIIDAEVREVIQEFGFPGTRVLLFAFVGVPENPHIPHNHIRNCLLYTGTHDNNTVRGWFETEASPEEKERVYQYLGRNVPAHEIHQEFIRLAMSSVADTVILPLQDILGLGAEARMNRPATTQGNWEWRASPDQINDGIAEQLRSITGTYERH
jgi:4-alpha-glucanotransferase